MKEGWEYSTIGNLCDKMNGLWKGKIGPFVKVGVIRNANFTKAFTLSFDNIEYLDVEAKQYKTRKLVKGDLIVEKSGGSEKQPVGRTVLFDKEKGEYSFSNFTSVLRIKDRNIISPEFLYKYILFVYLRGDTRKMQKATTGIHNIEFDKFLSIPAKIDAMKANAEKALNEAKALFQASLKEMLEPKEGWEEKVFGDLVVSNIVGLTRGKVEQGYDRKYPYFKMNNISPNNTLCWDDLICVDANEEELEKYCLQEGDFLFNTRNSKEWVGKSTVYRDYDAPVMLYNNNVMRIRFVDTINPVFVAYSFLVDYTKDQLDKIKSGTTNVWAIYYRDLSKIFLTYPLLSEQQSIVATLDSLKSKVDRLQENYDKISQECDALKQAILRQVFE